MDDARCWAEILDGSWIVRWRSQLAGECQVAYSRARGPRVPLTARQRRIAELAARGCSGKQIALELGLAPSTVAWHLQGALGKLGLTRSELGLFADRGLGRPPLGAVIAPGLDAGDALLVMTLQPPACPLSDSLTPAERAVAGAAIRGLSNREIADASRRSSRTVRNLLSNVFLKLRIASRAELYAYEAGRAPARAQGS